MNIDLTTMKKQLQENPLLSVGIAVGAVNAVTRLLDATTKSRNARTWKKEVNRRARK